MELREFNDLIETFRNTHTLPQLPEAAMKLVELSDRPDATCEDLERIVSSDPALAASILRAGDAVTAGRPYLTKPLRVHRFVRTIEAALGGGESS